MQGAPRGINRLTALLEDTITEVVAPGGGAFHPKLWLLRFVNAASTARLRLALLSRNITRDASWDLSLSLDGEIGPDPDPANAPLSGLIAALPGLAAGRATPRAAVALTAGLAAEVARARWVLPPGFASVGFAVNGLGGTVWQPRIGRNLGIVSPFVGDKALTRLTRGLEPDAVRLLSRDDELARLAETTRARFGRIDILDDLAESGDGEGREDELDTGGASGLHAKAFVTERWSTTEITIGSGNATSPALLDGRNVEVFATLSGPTSRLGSMDDQFAPDRLGRFLRPFTPHPPLASAATEAESRIEAGVRALAASDLRLRCRRSGEGLRLTLEADAPVASDDLDVEVWPLVPGPQHATGASRLGSTPVVLGTLALRDVTRWLGFRLRDRETGVEKLVSLGAELLGLPEGRAAEILRSIVANREAFLRYLRLLLADLSDPMSALLARGGTDAWLDGSGIDEAPILEDMVRALSGDARQLRDIERLVARLGPGGPGTGASVIPDDFLALWAVFREALPRERRRREPIDA